MAKKSMIAREVKRAKLVARYAEKRTALKAVIRNINSSDEERQVAQMTARSERGVIMRAEALEQLETSIDGMDPIDREVLVLRHVEQLSTAEIAQVLQITKSDASRRYFRALKSTKEMLAQTPGLFNK